VVLCVADIDHWDPNAVLDVFHGASERAAVAADTSDGLRRLPVFSTWGGMAEDAAKAAIGATRVDLDAHGQEALAVAQAARIAANGIEKVKADLTKLRSEAASLDMAIDPVTDTVLPGPGFSGNPMELLLKQQQLQPRLTAIIAEANGVDAELAQAINMADGRMPIPGAPAQAVDRKLSGGPDDAANQGVPGGPSTLADLERANDRAAIDAMNRVKAAQHALDQASAEAYTHGAGSPEAEAALAQLPKQKQDLATALNDLGKVPDYANIDPKSLHVDPNGNLLFSYLANGQVMQVTGMLKNGTGEIFDQGTKAYYTYQNGKLVGTRFLDEGRAIATNEPLLTAVTTAVGAGPLVKGGEAGWLGLRALFGAEGAEAGTSITADNVLPHAADLAAVRADAATHYLAVQGPGAWEAVTESMSARAAEYQMQITGHPITDGYLVNGVKFDGFAGGFLEDAKSYYAQFTSDGQFMPWWVNSPTGGQAVISQAVRQVEAAGGAPIRWSIAEPEALSAFQHLLDSEGITQIQLVLVPPK
jgi:hypothetical protein